jgi:endonuclease/exonuclease/phosphatase family metal-dependent hydrolase
VSHPVPRLGALAGAVAATLALAAPAAAAPGDASVMTRNVYLGADLIPLAAVPDRPAFEQAAAERFAIVQANDFSVRARALAAEVRRHRPDVLALQEAAIWRRGAEGVKDGPATPATEVIYDSLAVLDRALRAAGQRYRLVRRRAWFDFEAPTALNRDIRITQQDAILVRTGRGARVRPGRTFAGGFRRTFDPPTQYGVARQRRGWVGFDGRVRGGGTVRFITTHLEAYSAEIGDAQARQLLREPAASRRVPTVLVGDINSDPRQGADDRGTEREPNAYRSIIDGGFLNPLPRRETCCFGEDLRPASGRLESWIDHILTRPRMRVLSSAIVGSRSSDRVGGLWPSDHAGIVATLRTRRQR